MLGGMPQGMSMTRNPNDPFNMQTLKSIPNVASVGSYNIPTIASAFSEQNTAFQKAPKPTNDFQAPPLSSHQQYHHTPGKQAVRPSQTHKQINKVTHQHPNQQIIYMNSGRNVRPNHQQFDNFVASNGPNFNNNNMNYPGNFPTHHNRPFNAQTLPVLPQPPPSSSPSVKYRGFKKQRYIGNQYNQNSANSFNANNNFHLNPNADPSNNENSEKFGKISAGLTDSNNYESTENYPNTKFSNINPEFNNMNAKWNHYTPNSNPFNSEPSQATPPWLRDNTNLNSFNAARPTQEPQLYLRTYRKVPNIPSNNSNNNHNKNNSNKISSKHSRGPEINIETPRFRKKLSHMRRHA